MIRLSNQFLWQESWAPKNGLGSRYSSFVMRGKVALGGYFQLQKTHGEETGVRCLGGKGVGER